MYTLGINAAYHDTAACLVKDGQILAAAEEERFTHIKHGKRPIPFSTYELPFHAIDFCLKQAGITMNNIDHVAYSYDPFILDPSLAGKSAVSLPLRPASRPPANPSESPWDPLFLCLIMNAPGQLADGVPHHLQERFRNVPNPPPYQWHYVEHHTTHAASAF